MNDSVSRRGRLRPVLVLVVVIVAVAAVWWFKRDAGPAQPPPFSPWSQPVPVLVAPAVAGELSVTLRAVGHVTPLQAVTVNSRVNGALERVLFEEGQEVRAGTLLAEIDPRPYRSQLAEAEADHARSLAQLRNAERDLVRARSLLKEDSIARQEAEASETLVAELQAAVAAGKARVEDARLQLSWTRVEAPIDGRLGLRGIDAGNLVSANDTELVSIVQTRPIGVLFSLPGHELAAVRAALREGRELQVEALDRDDRTVLATGRLDTFDNRIDMQTGTVRMKAHFANEDEALFPHQFVNVRLSVGVQQEAVTIPADAVQYGARGAYVYVIDEEERARVRAVEPGRVDEGRVAILSGLEEGEAVVLEGFDRLREGRQAELMGEAVLRGGAR